MTTGSAPLSTEDVHERRRRAGAGRDARASVAAGVAARAALAAGALVPWAACGVVGFVLCLVVPAASTGGEFPLLFAGWLFGGGCASGGALILGHAVGRMLAKFHSTDSRSRLVAQGALLGGVLAVLGGLVVFTGCSVVAQSQGQFEVRAVASAVLGIWGAICGGAAGLGVAHNGRQQAERARRPPVL